MRLLGRYIQKGEYYHMKTMGYKRMLTLLGCCILFLGTAGYIVKANSTEKKRQVFKQIKPIQTLKFKR